MTRDEVLKEYAYTKIDYDLMALEGEAYTAWNTDAMADEIVRLRAILAKLREPSEKILLAAVEAVPYGASYAALMRCIPAAVAAAEQEVDHFVGITKMVRQEVANDAG